MKRTRPDSCIRVMGYSECLIYEKEIIQIEAANTVEGFKPYYMVEYGGSTEAELRSQFYEEFQEGFQKDEIELMGRKCSEWNSIFHEWTQIEFYQKEQAELKERLEKLVNAFNDYECAGPEQEQENTWEILRELMHQEMGV